MKLSSHERTQLSFNSLPGQGVIFSVVVKDPAFNTSAAYVPAHTYACSFKSTLDGCHTLGEAEIHFRITLKECLNMCLVLNLLMMFFFSRESFH